MPKSSSLVAVVTGSSRGIGKGVATALGSSGATVYVTGRTRQSGESDLPGTIHQTAEEVTAAGGTGIAVHCDHGIDEQVKSLFERVERESGRLDILVNNVASIHPSIVAPGDFWEKPLALADLITVGLRSHYVASWYAAPMMVRQRRGLIASISFYGAVCYFHGPAYGAQKAGIDKMTADMAVELKPHNVAAVSLWPGFVATEFALQAIKDRPELAGFAANLESPRFIGQVIERLARDPALMSHSGRALIVAEQAAAYGLRDVDGRQPPSYRETMGSPREPHPAVVR